MTDWTREDLIALAILLASAVCVVLAVVLA